MKKYNIFVYANGPGSGHVSRVNAIYKGFSKAGINSNFFACVNNSKYCNLLDEEIIQIEESEITAGIDIFICDWKANKYILSLPRSIAKSWIGLKRLSQVPTEFPSHFHVIAIEPDVLGDALFYPIISTYPNELKTRESFLKYLKLAETNSPIALYAENGDHEDHLKKVFDYNLNIDNLLLVKSSNSRTNNAVEIINFYPVAEFFSATDYLVIGGGYNSVHEALCYANIQNTVILPVGGDDQERRIELFRNWDRKRSPESHLLARYILNHFHSLLE